MQSVCEQVYSIIYAEDIKQQLLKAIGNKKRKRTDIADVYALKKRMQVEIVFPISPFLSHGDLYTHYQNGLITWDTYSQHACANASLPYEQLQEPKEEPKEEVKEEVNEEDDTKEE